LNYILGRANLPPGCSLAGKFSTPLFVLSLFANVWRLQIVIILQRIYAYLSVLIAIPQTWHQYSSVRMSCLERLQSNIRNSRIKHSEHNHETRTHLYVCKKADEHTHFCNRMCTYITL